MLVSNLENVVMDRKLAPKPSVNVVPTLSHRLPGAVNAFSAIVVWQAKRVILSLTPTARTRLKVVAAENDKSILVIKPVDGVLEQTLSDG